MKKAAATAAAFLFGGVQFTTELRAIGARA